MTEQLSCVIQGRVQGVGFRAFVVQHARRLGLTGWVRNRPDGRAVECLAQGPRPRLLELRELVEQGPPGARVEDVVCEWSTVDAPLGVFEIRR